MWRRLSAGGGLTASGQRGCLPDERCVVTGSCLMSKSLLKLHLVCAEFDPKAQPDTLAHWSLIDVSVFTGCYQSDTNGRARTSWSQISLLMYLHVRSDCAVFLPDHLLSDYRDSSLSGRPSSPDSCCVRLTPPRCVCHHSNGPQD